MQKAIVLQNFAATSFEIRVFPPPEIQVPLRP